MAKHIVTAGFGTGTLSGAIDEVVLRGFAVGIPAAASGGAIFTNTDIFEPFTKSQAAEFVTETDIFDPFLKDQSRA